ncbi:hypothetical protein SISSUDRAFT_81487 [Sistotremastrum suecicum HHB10207 ss-3]|uniref:Uncharacterized protein n=1 Tax=Sistotremastrum suecicum HHB10207 ss-3 TaxID=1314776 RepID=A0A166H5J8_9AGAM|nr:hypothetical protein SISSUDRAFT_81487 [Sistotremastrum suecicum HHB10207 ss-3]
MPVSYYSMTLEHLTKANSSTYNGRDEASFSIYITSPYSLPARLLTRQRSKPCHLCDNNGNWHIPGLHEMKRYSTSKLCASNPVRVSHSRYPKAEPVVSTAMTAANGVRLAGNIRILRLVYIFSVHFTEVALSLHLYAVRTLLVTVTNARPCLALTVHWRLAKYCHASVPHRI